MGQINSTKSYNNNNDESDYIQKDYNNNNNNINGGYKFYRTSSLDGKETRLPSIQLTIPFLNFINQYTLKYFNQILQTFIGGIHLLESTQQHDSSSSSSSSYVCCNSCSRHIRTTSQDYKVILHFGTNDDIYDWLEVFYILIATKQEDIELFLNAILNLLANTSDLTNYTFVTIFGAKFGNENRTSFDRPLILDLNSIHTILTRTNSSTSGCNFLINRINLNSNICELLSSSIIQDNLKLKFISCTFEDNGTSFLKGLTNNNHGPTELEICLGNEQADINNEMFVRSIFSTLASDDCNNNNTRLEKLAAFQVKIPNNIVQQIVKRKIGLKYLSLSIDLSGLHGCLQSLYNHPTLQTLSLMIYVPSNNNQSDDEIIKQVIGWKLVNILNTNIVLQRIDFYFIKDIENNNRYEFKLDQDIIQNEIQPRLIINKYRSRIYEINNEQNETIRIQNIIKFIIDFQKQSDLSLIWLMVRDNCTIIIDQMRTSTTMGAYHDDTDTNKKKTPKESICHYTLFNDII